MRPIVGGHVPPDRVVGRDEFISRMWATLEDQSIALVSERRIGKTSVLKKMAKEPLAGWHPLYMPIEGVSSPIEFVGHIIDAVVPVVKARGRASQHLQRILGELAGQKFLNWHIPERANHWKRLLAQIMRNIQENFEQRFVFLWDELPLMIDNIMKNDLGTRAAMGQLPHTPGAQRGKGLSLQVSHHPKVVVQESRLACPQRRTGIPASAQAPAALSCWKGCWSVGKGFWRESEKISKRASAAAPAITGC